jgi:hypothetical protein
VNHRGQGLSLDLFSHGSASPLAGRIGALHLARADEIRDFDRRMGGMALSRDTV